MPPHSTTSLSSYSPTTTTTTIPPRIRIPLPPNPTNSSTNTTTTSTHQPLPTALRSTINAHLLSTSAITTIQSVLLHHLQRSGWTDNVRQLVLDLLRSGECKTFGECMGVVIREARGDLTGTGKDGRRESMGGGDGQGQGKEREEGGEGLKNAEGRDGVDGVAEDAEKTRRNEGRRVNVDVRIPERVVDEGVQVVREALEEIVEVVDG